MKRRRDVVFIVLICYRAEAISGVMFCSCRMRNVVSWVLYATGLYAYVRAGFIEGKHVEGSGAEIA